jgi:hypothetical protein
VKRKSLPLGEAFFLRIKKRPETSSMLLLAVVRTSRHPQSASMLNKGAVPSALEPAILAFSNLVET